MQNGSCLSMNISEIKQFSHKTFGMVCRPGYLQNTQQSCSGGNDGTLPASNMYVKADNSLGVPNYPDEIFCPGDQSLAFQGNTAVCGYPLKVPHNKYEYPQVGRCTQQTQQYSALFGQCVSSQSTDPYQQATELCMAFDPKACFYLYNNISRLSVLNSETGPIPDFFALQFGYISNWSNDIYNYYKSYADSSANPNNPGGERMLINYTNIIDLQIVLTDANGTLLSKQSVYGQNFDICNFAKYGVDPNIQNFGSQDEIINRDTRLFRNTTYYNIEMLRRSHLDGIDVSPINFYHSMFGNNVQKSCRIGIQQIIDMPEVYIAFYSNMQYTNASENPSTKPNVNVYMPIKQGGNYIQTVPIKAMTKAFANGTPVTGQPQLKVLSGLSINITYNSTGVLGNIQADYIDVSVTPGFSILRTEDLSSYGFTNMHKYLKQHQQGYVDFTFTLSYQYFSKNQIGLHLLYIACVLVCALFHLIFRVITARHIYQGLNRSTTGAAARLDSIYPLLVGFVKSILLGSVFFIYCIGCASFVPIWTGPVNDYLKYNGPNIYGVMIGFTVLLLAARIGFMVNRKMKLFVVDHAGVNGIPSAAWRRIFACNALWTVIKEQNNFYELIIIIFTLLFMTFDLQYLNINSITGALTTYFTTSQVLFPTMIFLLLNTYVGIVVFKRIVRFFTGRHPVERLGDLLPLLDCSIVVFDTFGGAHVIYGRSFFGNAEKSPQELCKVLKREAKGLYQRRGLKTGSSSTFYRVFYNQRVDYLKDIRSGIGLLRSKTEPTGDFGEQPVPGQSNFGYSGLSAQIPCLGAAQYEVFQDVSSEVELLMQKLSDEPHFCGMKLTSFAEAPPKLPKTLDVAVVADKTEGFSVFGRDDGRRLPGGLGASPWICNAFQKHQIFWDIIATVGIASISTFSGNIGIVFIAATIFIWSLRQFDILYARKVYGNYMFLSDAML